MNKILLVVQLIILILAYFLYEGMTMQQKQIDLLDRRVSGISAILQKEMQKCIDFSRVVE